MGEMMGRFMMGPPGGQGMRPMEPGERPRHVPWQPRPPVHVAPRQEPPPAAPHKMQRRRRQQEQQQQPVVDRRQFKGPVEEV